jgi:tetratricopeptide (TPR) repeat protein
LDSIDIAININPIKANYYFLKAYCLDKLNKQQEALVSYDKAIELCHIKSIFYLRRGNIKLAMGYNEAGKNDIVHYKKMERIFIDRDF